MNSVSVNSRLRFLILAATFPPRGGSSVQRVAKFAKYAKRFGHEPIVVTTSYQGKLCDPSLVADLPSDLEVHRVAPDPANLGRFGRLLARYSYPDPYRAWGRAAFRKCESLIHSNPVDAIFVSFGMPSALLVGASLARRHNIPLVLDIRDLWTFSRKGNRRHRLGPLAAPFDRFIEARAWRNVDRYIVVSEGYRETLCGRYGVPREAVEVVYNGYDSEDFQEVHATDGFRRGAPTVAFTGFVTEDKALRTTIRALTDLNNRRSLTGEPAVRLHMIGGTSDAGVRRALEGAAWPAWLQSDGYRPHEEALRLMCSADVLLLMQPREHGMLTGKFFEYCGSRRPILHLDNGTAELRQLISQHRLGLSASQEDATAVAETLQALLGWNMKPPTPPECFRRDVQARRFLEILSNAVAERHESVI